MPHGSAQSIKVAICDGNDEQRHELTACLGKVTELDFEIVNASEMVPYEVHHGGEFQILIVVMGDDPESWPLQTREWREKDPRRPIIAATGNHSPGAVRQALRCGADDVIFFPVEPNDLLRSVVKIVEVNRVEIDRKGGSVCAVASVAGGVGVSSISVCLAFALRRLTGKQVALMDLGLQCGALAALLDLNPEQTLADLVDPTSSIDSIRLEAVLCRHSSGLQLIAAPKLIEEGEMVSVTTIGETLKVLRGLFDFVVVDCGHHMNEGLVSVWEQSQYLLYMVNQSLTSIRPAQQFMDLFARLKLHEVELNVVANRFIGGHPFSLEKIEDAIRRPVSAVIPRDDDLFTNLQLRAEDFSLLAANSAATAALNQLAGRLCGVAVAHNGRHPTFF